MLAIHGNCDKIKEKGVRYLKKEFVLALAVLLLLTCLTGCSQVIESLTVVEISGIDNFSPQISSMSLTSCLLPSETFLQDYPYTNGSFYYYEKMAFVSDDRELVFMELDYSSEVYEQVKQYCLDNMNLSEVNVKELNGYIFQENLNLPKMHEHLENGVNTKFPYFFTMFAYNDSLQTLLFLGFHCDDYREKKTDTEEKADIANEDWGGFLQEFFGEYYDFAQ